MDPLPVSSNSVQAGRPGRRAVVVRPRLDGEGSSGARLDGEADPSQRSGPSPAAPSDRSSARLGRLPGVSGPAPGEGHGPQLLPLELRPGLSIVHGNADPPGKGPGRRYRICAYGPMPMYTSALGLWVSQSLIGETLICASAYALCLFLIYRLVGIYSSKTIGLAAAGFGFVLMSRFYKWYVWLIPLATLWALHRYLSAPIERRPRWIVGTGLVGGLCWLFRPDMGTMLFIADLVFLTVIETCSRPRGARFIVGASIALCGRVCRLPAGLVRVHRHRGGCPCSARLSQDDHRRSVLARLGDGTALTSRPRRDPGVYPGADDADPGRL